MAVATFTRSSSVLWRQSPWSVLVLPGQPGAEVLALEGAATVMWEVLDAPRSADDLLAAVAERYGVEPASIETEVHAALERLVALGLVERG